MSKFAMRIFDKDGIERLNSSDMVARIRYYTIALSNSDGSIVLSDISGKATTTFSIPYAGTRLPHLVSLSGTTLSWEAQFDARILSSDSLIGIIIRD